MIAGRKPQHPAAGPEYRVIPAGPNRWRIVDRQQRNHGAYTERAAADKAYVDLNAKACPELVEGSTRHTSKEEPVGANRLHPARRATWRTLLPCWGDRQSLTNSVQTATAAAMAQLWLRNDSIGTNRWVCGVTQEQAMAEYGSARCCNCVQIPRCPMPVAR